MNSSDPIVIVSCARTPMGGMQGDFATVTASELGGVAIKAALERGGVSADDVDEVIMGNVLPAGQGQAPARQAAWKAGIPRSAGATTINKMCGSGMKAVMFAHDILRAGSADVMVVGGMESMTNAPFLLPNMRSGQRYGHTEVYDHMALDGLEDAYEKGRSMGTFAEATVDKYGFTREQQDDYAITSLTRAQNAASAGHFDTEIAPVSFTARKGDVTIFADEQPPKAKPEKIPTLRPAFRKDGTVTAAHSASISDGAAAMVMMRQSEAEKRGLKPMAKIMGHATHAQEPCWFTTAPIDSIKKVLAKTGWAKDDVDLWEINEAFAVVAMAAMRDLDLDHGKVNIHGGACALGHPIGATGARLLVTLIHALKTHGGTKGVASLCIGGGEATAVAIELL
ncbi:acetyl-CoA C-acyltransferase [Thalassospira xianhensis]|uniref:Acetyl-CoA acetyltransferase n=1 Tax=Thalassospira xianhensis MCCC 1A02616 TaxID=1177929 RepID=A0A367UCE5_9PROT|nr:acetyl-CoA C-acyltransferase [Thalassospira xianhensis]RCK04732.1 acetyl-CoA acetyltransferase [Thalassospira xianhensis MCCC 1A02616]